MPISSAAARGEEKTKRQVYWEWLRDHPSSTAREIAEACGTDQMNISTVLTKFVERGIVERVKHNGVFTYITSVGEYPTVTMEQRVASMLAARVHAGKRKAKAKAKTSVKAKREAVEKSLDQRKAELAAPGVTNGFVDSTQAFINSLTVHQAKAVYDELKKIFGG